MLTGNLVCLSMFSNDLNTKYFHLYVKSQWTVLHCYSFFVLVQFLQVVSLHPVFLFYTLRVSDIKGRQAQSIISSVP